MQVSDVLIFMALATFALFVVTFASLLRLARAGLLAGRRPDGSPSAEAMAHSFVKLAVVLVLTVALSRVLLAPRWSGGPFAPDLAMALASGVSLAASVPAAVFVALLLRPAEKRRGAVLVPAAAVALVSSGAGQAVMSGVNAGRNVGALLSPAAWPFVVACGVVGCAGLWLHALLVRRIEAQPNDTRLALADSALGAITTVLAVWLACLAYPLFE